MFKKTAFIALLLLLCSMLFSQTVTVETQSLEIKQGEKAQIKINIAIPEGQHCTKQEDYLYVDVDSLTGLQSGLTIYPQGDKKDELGNEMYYKQITLIKEITADNSLNPGSQTLKLKVGYQFCNEEGTCLIPEEVETSVNLNVLKGQGLDIMTVLKFILLAFIGGIILNVMPCVLPVLSIKALSIVKQSHQDKKDIFRHSLAYTFGILVSFLILSTIVILIKLSGELVGWGFQFQNPGFVIVLYSVMFVFALSMFDVLVFQAPGMNMAYQASGKTGFSGSFLSGIFAVILATPCTAPFLGAALGFAFSQPPLVILFIFLSIGLGLALPFLMIGFFPGSIKIFPKPGNWMNIFKESMGFLLLATAVWLLNVIYSQLGGSNLIRVLFFTVVLAFASWLYGSFVKPQYSRTKQWIMTVVAVLVVIFGAYFLLQFNEVKAENNSEIAHNNDLWKVFSEEEVNQLVSEGKPVFVDFSAEWCMTCKSNETTVLWTKEIEEAFAAKNVTLFRGDYTRKDPIIHAWLKKYNKAGVPLYLLFIPGQSDPVVFPELITKGMVLDKINLIPESNTQGETE
jgi:thiol:disulfide interchange protein DsbD